MHLSMYHRHASMRPFAVLALVLLGVAATATAQTTTGRIEGSVQDQTGAVIPNAHITVVNLKTQVKAETNTNTAGYFVVTALPNGEYALTAEAQGFRKYALNDITLEVGASFNTVIKLEVGQTTESVQVEATTVNVQTTESQISRAVTMRDIDTLPQLGRTPITLSVFVPGVSYGGTNPGDNSFSRVNGQRQGSNNTTLDGIDVNDAVVPRLGLSLTANNTDSVGEIRVITEGAKAEYGRNAGGQVEMITRSGTNAYHGNAFDYLRNTDLNANDFFNNSVGAARPILIQNVFGGSFGGPIKHDKLFIFGNYQGRRTNSTISRVRTVPTDTARQGLFLYRPTNGGGAVQTVDLKAIDPQHIGIDPQVAKLLALFPEPNDNSVGDGLNSTGFRFNNPNNSYEDQFTIKADYNMTQNNHFFFRESWQRNSSIDSLNSADAPFPGGVQGTQGGHRWGVSTGWDWIVRASLVNEFRYGHQSADVAFNRPERVAGIMYPFNVFTNPILTNFAQGRNSPVDEYTDNLTWIKGAHTFKTGVNARYIDQYGYNYNGVYPNASFSTANGNAPPASVTPPNISATDLTRFQNLYNDLLGRVGQISQTFYSDLKTFQPTGQPVVRNYLFRDWGAFFQDDWKIRRNLTVNIGLRWEYFGVPRERDGLQGTVTAINTLDPGNPSNNLTVTRNNAWYKSDLNNFAPRFGFSWDPKGDGKTAIRGNYGIFYDRAIGAITSSVDGSTPGFADNESVTPNLSGGDFRANQNPALPTHAAAPLLTPPDNRSVSFIYLINPNLATGYVHEYSFGIQRELMRNAVLDVAYVGSRGGKLFMERDINQSPVYTNGFLRDFQELQAYCPTSACLGPTPSASNTIVRIFGSPKAAVTGVGGATVLGQGQLGTAANNVDRGGYTKYAAAGVSDFYLRPFPQFQSVRWGTNDGRSYYDSLQVSFRRTAGDLKYTLNYTFSKNLDNISVDANGFTSPLDNFNLALNKGLSDADHTHSFNWSAIYALPWGRGKRFGTDMPGWVDSLTGGWEIGLLGVWQSGNVFSVLSGLNTGPYYNVNTNADYTGDRKIGNVTSKGNGVFYFTPQQIAAFTSPAAGTVGTSGRNAFRGPKYFDTDASLVKRFKITERQSVTFRAEAYNLFNNVNFQNPNNNITSGNFGKISTDFGGARVMQMALRYDF